MHELGNFYADKVSKLRKEEELKEIDSHELVSKSIEIEEVLQGIMRTDQWNWVNMEGKVGYLSGPMIQIHNNKRK